LLDRTDVIEISQGKILKEVYFFDSFRAFKEGIFNSVLTVQKLDFLADIFNQNVAAEMLSCGIDLNLKVVSEPEVFFLVSFIVALTVVH
jgi:hypothetical protein